MEQKEVVGAWGDAIEVIQESENAKAFVAGVRIRVNLPKLLDAVWRTAMLVAKVAKAKAGGFSDPSEVIDFGDAVVSVVTTGLAAFREHMPTVQYYACVMLSRYGKGCPRATFEDELRSFIQDATGVLPWYLGLSEGRANEALHDLDVLGGPDPVIEKLRERGLLEDREGALYVVDKNLEWGFHGKAAD